MHTLGAIHTHQRMDRDEHIYYQKKCRRPDGVAQFEKVNFNFPSDSVPYEYNSIMHYPCQTFSICEGKRNCDRTCPTLFPKYGKCSQVGSYIPTPEDWKMINQYQCTGNNNIGDRRTTKKIGLLDPWYCGSDPGMCSWFGCSCPALCRC